MAIKNIIFDFGGVLFDIDYNLTTKAFLDLGYKDFEKMYSQYSADRLFSDLETGEVSAQTFYHRLNEIKNVDHGKVEAAWNAMLLGFRWPAFEYLKNLKDQYRLFLLSNTNEIHKAAFDEMFKSEVAGTIDQYFEKAYYSHLVRLRKPGGEIFKYILKDAALRPEETLFIDDSYNNLEEPQKLGIKTHLLKPGETIETVLPAYLTSSNSI